ncbi:MAG: triple tyrosine motif-containing protein [Ferruginibacter sp.]
MLRFILVLLLNGTINAVLAQPLQQFLYRHLSTRDGLASDETMGIQQDAKGYIWIATMDGLQRYDGKRLITFRNSTNHSQTIPNDMVRQIQFDKKNRLWVCCSENKVGYFNVDNFTFHQVNIRCTKDLLEKSDGHLYIDNNGNILFILPGACVFTYNEQSNDFSEQKNPFRVPARWKVNRLIQDQLHHNYWLACDSGLAKFNPVKKTLSYRAHNADRDEVIGAYEHLQSVSTPYFDKARRFWLLSSPAKKQTNLYSYNTVSKKITEWQSRLGRLPVKGYYYVHTVKEQKDGSVWIIGDNLFAKLNEQGNAFDIVQNNLPGEFSIRYDVLKDLYEDSEQNLWVCTNNGLFRFNPSAQFFHAILNKRIYNDSIYPSGVSDILQTKQGDIIVSTRGNGIFSYDKNFNPINAGYVKQSLQLGERLTNCILQRRNGDIWRGNQYGTIFISYASGKTEKIQPAIFEGQRIHQLTEDYDGNIWLATVDGQLIKWDANTRKFSLIKKLNTVVERLYTDANGHIWVCSRSGLFNLNSTDGSVVEHYTASGVIGKQLWKPYALDIIQYNDSLFIIASGCLNILNTRSNTIRHLMQPNEFPVNNVSNIAKDKLGKIWATTLSGLCNVDIENRLTIAYDERDGVHTNSFYPASITTLNDGRIAIGTSHDILVFDPVEIDRNLNMSLPGIHITGFLLMNKDLLMDSINKLKSVELPYDKNSVIIEFSTLTYQNNFSVSYLLEGLDKTWKNDYGANRAIYTYLPAGNYTFQVKVENGDEAGSVKYASLKLRVKAPFWKTWWFLGLLAFVLVGVVYWLDKLRTARIRDTERVRTRIATSLTKDMTNTLGNINVLSELANVKLDKDTERTREYIQQISENSSRMMEVMDDMIWSINPENDELQYTIARMKKYAAQIQPKYNIEISFEVDEKVNEIKLNMDRRHELFLIFKEALLNAGKHARSKFADVFIGCENGKIKMEIADNGKGFDMEAVCFGRGINEMQKKAAALKATLTIHSEINTGTTVRLIMAI